VVFVDQATEDIDSLDVPVSGRLGALGGGVRRRDRDWDGEVEAAVGTCRVVVRQVGGEDPLKVALVPDQEPVEALGAYRAYPPLGIRVRSRRPRWES